MKHRPLSILVVAGCCLGAEGSSVVCSAAEPTEKSLHVGFAEADITPKLGKEPVYMAGFGQNRKATGIHDPLKARVVVLRHEDKKLALASVDLVGFFHKHVVRIREQLPTFTYVLVSSTHNHEGPDTLGLWGPNPFTSGVDAAYLKFVEDQVVKAVREAERTAMPVTARLGTARAPELLHDGREPYVKHDELVAVQFLDAKTGKPTGLIVQWNCHPETLADKNTEVSSDFVGPTVNYLRERHGIPVVYLTGTVGGLMTSLHVEVKNEQGKLLEDGTVEKTERYGQLLGSLADQALKAARPVQLTPLEARHKEVHLPMDNKMYLLGRQLGVLERQAFFWGLRPEYLAIPRLPAPVGVPMEAVLATAAVLGTNQKLPAYPLWANNPYRIEPAAAREFKKPLLLRTEVAWLRLGDLEAAAIPGEIYPELVLDKVQDPPDPGADFPLAPIEPAIYKQLRGQHRMMIGLANDEIGYIIPKRQWDEKPPFCYGRQKAQYGEINSVGPETAPILCRAFKELVGRKK